MDATVETARLVRDAGVPATATNVDASRAYIARTRRARRYGIVLGLIAGFGPLASHSAGGDLVIPRMIGGYLLGLLVGELFTPRPARSARRLASLRPRSPSDLLPRGVRWLPWLTLLPVVAGPVLLIGWHPRGTSHLTYSHLGSCSGSATWPTSTYLFVVAGLAAVALAATEFTLRRAATRQQPAEDEAMRALDHAMRAHSARSAVAAAAALGFVLLAQIASSVDDGIHSVVCLRSATRLFSSTGNVYNWGGTAAPWLDQSTILLLAVAIMVWFKCRGMRPPALDGRAEPA